MLSAARPKKLRGPIAIRSVHRQGSTLVMRLPLTMTGMKMSVGEAANGCEVLRIAIEILPGLIITNLNMPELGGPERVIRVAADPPPAGSTVSSCPTHHWGWRLK